MTETIVITGSTRGIGYGLADAFLARGCNAVVCGRSQESVDKALAALSENHDAGRMAGTTCEVTRSDDLGRLWDVATEKFGTVDVWINNAGLSHDMKPLWDLSTERMADVITTNVLGVALGSRVAMQGMQAQGSGQLYNMQGFGSNGQVRSGLSVYGASKAAVNSLTKALMQEAESTPVLVGSLSPGMVVTDLLLDPIADDPEAAKTMRIFNILADHVETVTPWLADQVLANDRNGAEIEWLTRGKIMRRFAASPFSKRDLFAQDG